MEGIIDVEVIAIYIDTHISLILLFNRFDGFDIILGVDIFAL